MNFIKVLFPCNAFIILKSSEGKVIKFMKRHVHILHYLKYNLYTFSIILNFISDLYLLNSRKNRRNVENRE